MTFAGNVSSLGYLASEEAKLNAIICAKGGASLHSWSFDVSVKCADKDQTLTSLTHDVPPAVRAPAAPASHSRSPGRRTSTPPRSFFRRRKPKDEKRLFICELRLRNPHAPRFPAPKIFRGAVAQYLPSRANRLVLS
jgi:hypothetical protein